MKAKGRRIPPRGGCAPMASSKFILRTEEALLTALLATELKAETDTEPIAAAKTRNLNMGTGQRIV